MNDSYYIFLENGGSTLVDANMVNFLSQYKWYRSWDGYVFSSFRIGEKTITKGMGAFILQTDNGIQCDHINGDKNDNRIVNLRAVTPQQNQWNQGKRNPDKSTSKFKGVYWCKGHNAWRSQIRINGRKIHLGTSKTEQEAAMKYNKAAEKHFGQYARLNIINKEPLAVAGELKG
ncbi:MAG: HNH endonuclease [Patescibacteria group bacterium]|nr:HNH endonuclease [Patescibacteria group bacterium]